MLVGCDAFDLGARRRRFVGSGLWVMVSRAREGRVLRMSRIAAPGEGVPVLSRMRMGLGLKQEAEEDVHRFVPPLRRDRVDS